MLSDNHLKVLFYEPDSYALFNNIDIKGGVAVTYRDKNKNYGAIETFTPYEELNSIMHKITNDSSFAPLTDIIVTSFAYHFTKLLYEDHPELMGRLSKGHSFDLKSNVIEKMPEIFFSEKPNDENEYVQILGREGNERVVKYIKKQYVNDVRNLGKYKLFFSKANGTGAFGETSSPSVIGEPNVGSTETFLSIGCFDSENEVNNTIKYIKTKFARSLLGILKITQDVTPEKWKYVPIQNFKSDSDIGWNESISEIDQQLYKKYNLSPEEIDFIETHVKEMT